MDNDKNGNAVVVEGVQKSFGAQKVLNGISFSLKRGEILSVLGRSGTRQRRFAPLDDRARQTRRRFNPNERRADHAAPGRETQ